MEYPTTYFALLSASILLAAPAYAGESSSNGGRGGIPDRVDEAAFAQYITDGGLKSSMLNYLNTLELARVSPSVKPILERMIAGGALRRDIESPSNYRVGLDDCHDAAKNLPDALALTYTGRNGQPNVGGRICFDVRGLVKQFNTSGIRPEDAVIKIAALTFHEHVHHFQDEASDPATIQRQEAEANAIGGYVELTAKLAQVPLIQWSLEPTRPLARLRNEFQKALPVSSATLLNKTWNCISYLGAGPRVSEAYLQNGCLRFEQVGESTVKSSGKCPLKELEFSQVLNEVKAHVAHGGQTVALRFNSQPQKLLIESSVNRSNLSDFALYECCKEGYVFGSVCMEPRQSPVCKCVSTASHRPDGKDPYGCERFDIGLLQAKPSLSEEGFYALQYFECTAATPW
jgi:hypothetical protein